MAASGEKRSRRKAPAGGSTPTSDPENGAAPATLPGLPGAPALPRAVRRPVTKSVDSLPLVAATGEAAAVAIDAGGEAAGRTVEVAETVADDATDMAETVADRVADTTDEVVETAASVSDRAVEQADHVAEQVDATAEAAADVVHATVGTAVETAAAPIEHAAQAAPINQHVQQEVSIMDTIQNTTEKTQAYFAEANDRARGTMEKSARFFQEMTEFSKGNVEAVVESSKIAARGFETMGQDAAAYFKTSFEEASQALRTLSTIKSPAELMKFQADYVRSSFDALVAQTSRGTEASLKLAGEVVQPISNRVAVAAEKIKVSA